MKKEPKMSQRLAVTITLLNALLIIVLISDRIPSVFASQPNPTVIRANALEIVDSAGRVRASISVHESETVNGKVYPERVLFRMADKNRSPKVKLVVSEEGSALGLSDNAEGSVQFYAKKDQGCYIKVVERGGRERIIKP